MAELTVSIAGFKTEILQLPSPDCDALVKIITELIHKEESQRNKFFILDKEYSNSVSKWFVINSLRFKWIMLWVAFHQCKTINRRNFISRFPGVDSEEHNGQHYVEMLELSHQVIDFVHKYESPESLPYSSGLEWWKYCMIESIKNIKIPLKAPNKDNELDGFKRELKALAQYQNPISAEDRLSHPNYALLIETAIRIAPHRKNESIEMRRARKDFRDFVWKRYLSSLKQLETIYSTPGLVFPFMTPYGIFYQPSKREKGVPRKVRMKFDDYKFRSGRGLKP